MPKPNGTAVKRKEMAINQELSERGIVIRQLRQREAIYLERITHAHKIASNTLGALQKDITVFDLEARFRMMLSTLHDVEIILRDYAQQP